MKPRTWFNALCCFMSAISVCLVIAAACKKLPALPDPVPTPSATPSLAPRLTPLRVSGSDFIDATGKRVYLLGAIPCCVGEIDWPLINSLGYRRPGAKGLMALTSVTESAMQRIADAGGNFVHIRLGPYTDADNEGNHYPEFAAYRIVSYGIADLSAWNEAFWAKVRGVIERAGSLGLYVEVDITDGWALRTDFPHPWAAGRNIQGYDNATCATMFAPPDPVAQAWIRKVLDETSHFPNVLYQVSNESHVCGISRGRSLMPWEAATIEIVHERGRLVGTNSHDVVIEEIADYVAYHVCEAPRMLDRPVMVNEYAARCGNTLSADEWTEEATRAARNGTSFHLWRGSMDDGNYAKALSRLRGIRP